MSTEPGVVSLMGGAFVNVWLAGADPVVIDGNVEMPGRGLDRVGVRPRRARGPHRLRRRGDDRCRPRRRSRTPVPCRHSRSPGTASDWCRGGVSSSPPPAPVARATAIGAAAALYLGIVRDTLFGSDPEAHALVTGRRRRRRSSRARRRPTPTSPTSSTCLRRKALRSSPPAPSAGCSSTTWPPTAASSPEPTSRHTRRSCARRRCGPWGRGTVALNPPPSVGRPDARRHARRAGAPRALDVGRRHRHPAPGPRLPPLRARPVPRPRRATATPCSLRSSGTGSSGCRPRPRPPTSRPSTSTATPAPSRCPSGYGAGMVIPGTGILLNNALGEPELNRLGLHAVAPGTRLASNMAPTTGRSAAGARARRRLARGRPDHDGPHAGARAQDCLRGDDLQHSIDAPRLHVRFMDDGSPRVEHEPSDDIAAAVEASGLPSHRYPGPHMYFGGVGAACSVRTGSWPPGTRDARRPWGYLHEGCRASPIRRARRPRIIPSRPPTRGHPDDHDRRPPRRSRPLRGVLPSERHRRSAGGRRRAPLRWPAARAPQGVGRHRRRSRRCPDRRPARPGGPAPARAPPR